VQWIIRFLVGGAAVSLFAMAGDILRPKGFAGLFSAAPSVALATIALAASRDGPSYAAIEARSMILGAVALFFYASGCVYLMARRDVKAGVACTMMLLAWAAVAFTLRFGLLE
jgi:uncharacterized membrane protein (GlpM family)